jgi:hypothetical protein
MEGEPFLIRRANSICSHRRSTTSPARNPCRNARRIADSADAAGAHFVAGSGVGRLLTESFLTDVLALSVGAVHRRR